MMSDTTVQIKKRSNWPLFLGLLLILGGYFGLKTVRFLNTEIAHGKISNIIWNKTRGGMRTPQIEYACLEIEFSYFDKDMEGDMQYEVMAWPINSEGYKKGDDIDVVFPKKQPEDAKIYSLSEYWFIPPQMVMMGFACVVWLIVYVIVVFKPWER